MNRRELFERVAEICRDVFDNEDLVLTEQSNASEVEEWDSLTNLSLFTDVEDEFGIIFSLEEMMNCRNLGELLDAILAHMNQEH